MGIVAHFEEFDPYRDANQDFTDCLHAWGKMRGEKLFPKWSDMDWMSFPLSLIPYFVVCDVKQQPLDFTYRFWGTAHAIVFHADYTGKSVRDVRPSEAGAVLFAQYERMLELRKPMIFIFQTLSGIDENLPIKEASLRLPFSDDRESITQIMSFSDNRQDSKGLSQVL